MTINEITEKNIIGETRVKNVTDYFKQPAVNKYYQLIAVLEDKNGDGYIAVTELVNWNPYSERSKYTFMNFRENDAAPWKTTVLPIEKTEFSNDQIKKYLITQAESSPEFRQALKEKNRPAIEKWIDEDPDKPYIILDDAVLSTISV